MNELPNCPQCNSEYVYEDGSQLVCPECAHEWTPGAENEAVEEAKVVKDANGNVLPLLYSSYTRDQLQNIESIEVDKIKVKGKEELVTIYKPKRKAP